MSLSQEQWRNATTIYQVGRKMGMSTRDIQIALITAMQESRLRNLRYGDRDSQGLFQQRPSQGWGSVAQVTDPVYASKKFYSTLRGLGERRYRMSMTQAAQAVQRSAYPDAYAKHIGLVRSIFPSVASRAGAKVTDMDGRPYGVGNAFQPMDSTARGFDPQTISLGTPELSSLDTANEGISTVDVSPLAANYGTPQEQAPLPGMPAAPLPSGGQAPPAWATPIGYGTNQGLMDSGAFGPARGLDGWRRAVVDAAESRLGDPYVWGGTRPGAFDCSGLIQWAYARAGKTLPRVSYAQANSGKRVGLSGLRPGDLVAWDNSSRNNGADHIAIYIGGGRIVEAPRPGLSVRTRKLGRNEGAWGVRMG